MPARWHDEHGQLFEGCLMCFYQGRILHLVTNHDRPFFVEAPCPRCNGLGYLADTGRPCTTPIPVDDDALSLARGLLDKTGRCPDCYGYGQRVRTDEDAGERTIITDIPHCPTCKATGRQPDTT